MRSNRRKLRHRKKLNKKLKPSKLVLKPKPLIRVAKRKKLLT